jgi:hypothetical protein
MRPAKCVHYKRGFLYPGNQYPKITRFEPKVFLLSFPYKWEFAITEFVLIEFDCEDTKPSSNTLNTLPSALGGLEWVVALG